MDYVVLGYEVNRVFSMDILPEVQQNVYKIVSIEAV